MTEFSHRLKIALANKEMRPAILAYRIGVDRSTISNYLNGKYIPKTEMILKICEVLECDAEWLSGYKSPAFRTKSAPVRVPVLGYVAAGIPITAIQEVLDFEELDSQMTRDGAEYFGLRIKGASMEPRICNGDTVIVRKQEDVENGQIAIVCVNGDQATCKKIIKQEGGMLIQPLNPAFETRFYTDEQVKTIPITIIGRVIELRGKGF